ncbi:hypothetical protein COV20_03365 [Candidatus Woesearchaeota archaeon CG10_big_fil_rev_8_21_14_0_10_45_16]|nr:MAG: hypothetical protein COV20_03365 [Candidatus Woesearchaeota archaeon CG10_big_fil_rev_8_21_14_0_10_45_16]
MDTVEKRTEAERVLKTLLQELDFSQILELVTTAKNDILIPLSIFDTPLHPAEALYKYLRENERLSNQDIAELLDRDQRSVWASYRRAKKKRPQHFLKKRERYQFNINLFRNRQFSILESIIYYLHTVHRLRTKEMARLLGSSPNSTAVLLKRAKVKHGKK